MTDTNATTLRNALASAIKNHVADSGLTAKDAASKSGVQLSRLYQVLRGDVEKISSDALVNILGGFGYRLTGINGSGSGTEIVLSLDKAECQALPEIEPPSASYALNVAEDENGAIKVEGINILPNTMIEVDGGISVGYEIVDSDPDAERVVADDE